VSGGFVAEKKFLGKWLRRGEEKGTLRGNQEKTDKDRNKGVERAVETQEKKI